jgi:hypothetical protein
MATLNSKVAPTGGGSTPVADITTAALPPAAASNAGLEYDVTDMNGSTRVKSDGVSWKPVGAGTAAEGNVVIMVAASRNLAASDAGALLKVTSASAVTLTLPAGLPPRFSCAIMQCAAGKVTIAASAPAAVHGLGGKLSTAGQYATIDVTHTDVTDDYSVGGQSGT